MSLPLHARTVRGSAPALLALALGLPVSLAAQERHVLTGAGTIWNLAGEVRIEGSRGRDIEVEVTRGGADAGRLEVTASGGQLRVRYPDDDIVYRRLQGRSSTSLRVRDDGTFGGGGGWREGRQVTVRSTGRGLEAHADLVVRVPEGARLELHHAVGRITVSNVNGDLSLDGHATEMDVRGTAGRLSLDNGSGDIRVENARGELIVDTGSGSVSLTGLAAMTGVDLDSGSGSITARDVTTTRFAVDVGSGRVSLDNVAADEVLVDTGSGSVRVSLEKLPRTTTIESGSGGVTLALPANAQADVDIDTGSGGITTDFPITLGTVRRREVRGRIGDGGARITVSTGSGSVRLEKR